MRVIFVLTKRINKVSKYPANKNGLTITKGNLILEIHIEKYLNNTQLNKNNADS